MGDQKLREKMRRSPAGWRLRELRNVYVKDALDLIDRLEAAGGVR